MDLQVHSIEYYVVVSMASEWIGNDIQPGKHRGTGLCGGSGRLVLVCLPRFNSLGTISGILHGTTV